MDILVRSPAPGEAAELAEFMRTCYLAEYGKVAPPADTERHLARYYADALIAEALADPTSRLLLIESSGRKRGYAWLAREAQLPPQIPARVADQLQRFYLHPDAIGSGLASTLMQATLRAAEARAAEGVYLSVWQQSARAVRFYGKHGFRALAEIEFRIGDTPYADWLMWRPG